jgi:cell division septal protein FtsQ
MARSHPHPLQNIYHKNEGSARKMQKEKRELAKAILQLLGQIFVMIGLVAFIVAVIWRYTHG